VSLFIDDLVASFYEAGGSGDQFGDICWAPISYVYDHRELWRPVSLDTSGTVARTFQQEKAGSDAYRRRMPLSVPHLKTNEEFPVVRAKPRPVIVISPGAPDRGMKAARGARKVHQDLTIVVPAFTLANRVTGALKVPQADIDQIRLLRFPEFFYLPKEAPFDTIGVAKLTRLTSVPTAHLERCGYRLSIEPRTILRDAIGWLLFGEDGESFALYQGQLREQ
jgi:hypothetical protein